MKIAIGSQNPTKIKTVEKAFVCFWPKKKFKFIAIKTNSGVKDQPMSDEECIKGAENRAKGAQSQTDADFGVGLEGGIVEVNRKYFTRAWMVVIDKKGKIGIGSSISAPLPDKFMKLIHSGLELGEVDDIITGRKDTKKKNGYFGLVSDNLITREKGYFDGMIMALAKFKKIKLFL